MDKIKIGLMTLLFVFVTGIAAFACGGASGVALTIEGNTGVSEQIMHGVSFSRSARIVGTGINTSWGATHFSGVGVGSNAAGSLSYAAFSVGGVAVPSVTGNGHWRSDARGTINLTRNIATGSCLPCGSTNGYFRSVTGTYHTSSAVNIAINN